MYSRLITYNDQGLRGLGCCGRRPGLGGITGAEAYQQAKAAESNLNPKDYQQNPNFSDANAGSSIENSSWLGYWSNPGGACGQSTQASLVQTGTGLALKTAAAADPEPISKTILSIGATISSMIFAHHAAAVRQEDQIFCGALPAAANAFQVLQSGVQNGTLTPAQGIDGLKELLSQFESMIAPSYGHSPFCNALCEEKLFLDAVVRYWTAKYQDMESQGTAPTTMSTTGAPAAAVAPGSMSTTETLGLGIAAVLALVFVGKALV